MLRNASQNVNGNASSRKPDTIKAAAKFARQAERETIKQARQLQKTTRAAEKFVKAAFKFYKGKAQPKSLYKAAKQTSTASTIVQQAKPQRKSVPKKAAKKTPAKSTKKTTTKAAKTPAKSVPRKAPTGKQYTRIGFHNVKDIQRAALSAQEPSTDGKELLGKNQMFALKVKGNMGNEAYPTLQKMRDKTQEYIQRKVPVGHLQFGVFQMPERTRNKQAYYAGRRQSERNERIRDKELQKKQQQEIKDLRKELARLKKGKK